MFSYCFNNPLNLDDATGNWPQWVKSTVKWVNKNIVKPIANKAQETLSKINGTLSKGISVGCTLGIVGITANVSVSVDTKGNVAIQGSYSWGVTSNPGFGASIGPTSMITNAPDVYKLEGEGGVVGGSLFTKVPKVGAIGFGGDLNIIPDSEYNKCYFGISSFKGIGTSEGKEFHAGLGGTTTFDSFNIYEEYERFYDLIMVW